MYVPQNETEIVEVAVREQTERANLAVFSGPCTGNGGGLSCVKSMGEYNYIDLTVRFLAAAGEEYRIAVTAPNATAFELSLQVRKRRKLSKPIGLILQINILK